MPQILGMAPITPTHGTPAPISSTSLLVDQVVICTDPANSGTVYIDDVSGNILCKLGAGQSFVLPRGASPYQLSSIQLDASAASQTAYVSYSVPGGGGGSL